ncbi:MAG: hypothetical protein U0796_12305 [Gemmatales bacterium]
MLSVLRTVTLQLLAVGLVVLLLVGNVRYTVETAALIRVGMSPAEVEAVAGKASPLLGCVFTPILKTRENGEQKIDALGITSSFRITPTSYRPLGPGLPAHVLHSPQEEFPTYFGQVTSQRYEFRLADELSIVVFYDKNDRVAKVYALPTTIQPGNWWVRMKWHLSQMLGL